MCHVIAGLGAMHMLCPIMSDQRRPSALRAARRDRTPRVLCPLLCWFLMVQLTGAASPAASRILEEVQAAEAGFRAAAADAPTETATADPQGVQHSQREVWAAQCVRRARLPHARHA